MAALIITHIPDSIRGRTATGRYWHKVSDSHQGYSLRTHCSGDQVTELAAQVDLASMEACWKRGCL